MLYLIQLFQNDKYCRSNSLPPWAASGVVGQDDQVGQNNTGLVVSDEEESIGVLLPVASAASFLFAASGLVGQADQVGQTKIGLVVSAGEECVDANLCIAASGQCCVVGGDGRGGFRCPDSC